MDNEQKHIDQLQAKLFRDKLRNVEASKLEEAARRMARNAVPNNVLDSEVSDPPAENDGLDKQLHSTGSFRAKDFND